MSSIYLIERVQFSNDYRYIEHFIQELFQIYTYISNFYMFVYVTRFKERDEG
jgi:hypothetical protein